MDPKLAIADFALRANTRGFGNYLDAGTYIYQPWEPIKYRKTSLVSEESRNRLHVRHPYYLNMQDRQITSADEPLRMALDLAIAKVSGLRVLIDGSCIGPLEMGTQLTVVSLINSLADNERVTWLGVGLQTETIPAYARDALSKPKVNIIKSDGLHFTAVGSVDILHRPFQPEPNIPWHRWRAISKRIVITIMDLIAFRTGAYFDGWDAWVAYREAMRQGVANADAVTVISKDVLGPIREESLPISAERLFVVPLGVDHIDKQLAAHPPSVSARVGEIGLSRCRVRLCSRCDVRAQEPRSFDPGLEGTETARPRPIVNNGRSDGAAWVNSFRRSDRFGSDRRRSDST